MQGQNPVFIPGPTNIPDVVRKALDIPTIDHRSKLFGQILTKAIDGVKRLLKTERASVFFFPATGTAGCEAAITNSLNAGDRVLAARYGIFSQRWFDICRRHGLRVDVIDGVWGEAAPLERYEERIKADTKHEIKAVLVVHNETTTGVKSDVAALRRALEMTAPPALLR